ncbi:hypothetical protein CCACVL1_20387 [Corchorus capsularis]|uniref:FBD domain-containing protein n=1 Tax=Corchorus capsularis TaxID=210143 RepID=A0A1R3HBF3_COCAP|nr:hypothetical protein CCACVL1_20387 [Corchorus capsularis]
MSRKLGGGDDRISQLPEEVMGHIVSFLNMKEPVGTRVLSKKWISFWTNHLLQLQSLDFDIAHFNGRNQALFMDYVDLVLRLRGPIDIEIFSLKYNIEFRSENHQALQIFPRVCHWIRYANICNVKKLELHIQIGRQWRPVRFPAGVFSSCCSSIVELKLENDFVFDVPPTLFPCLKVLHVYVRRPNINFFNRLINSSSPVLENLSINGRLLPFAFDIWGGYSFEIFVPTLRILRINLISSEEYFESCSNHLFIIHTPNLEFLTIQDEIFASYEISEIPYLVEANVCIGPHSSYIINNGEISEQEADRVMQVLQGIRHARSVILWENITAAIGHAFDDYGPLPMFPTLHRLKLCIDNCYGWKLLPHFLSNSPNLEFLEMEKQPAAFNIEEEDEAGVVPYMDSYDWDEPEAAPSCLGQYLKEIKLASLWRSGDEEQAIRYLLGNSMVLEIMTINFSEDAVEGVLDEYMIEEFPRASHNCELIFE